MKYDCHILIRKICKLFIFIFIFQLAFPYQPPSVLAQAQGSCSFSSPPKVENGNLMFSISGEDYDDSPGVNIRSSDGPGFTNFTVREDLYADPEENEDGSYTINYTIPLSDLASAFGGEENVALQKIYTDGDGTSTACGDPPLLADAVSGEGPDDQAPQPEPIPPDSDMMERYEQARLATEAARNHSKCVNDYSQSSLDAAEQGDKSKMISDTESAQACATALEANRKTIEDTITYWESMESETNIKNHPDYAAYKSDLERWSSEINSLQDTSNQNLSRAHNTTSTCSNYSNVIACSRNPAEYKQIMDNSQPPSGGNSGSQNPCLNESSGAIYQSPNCQPQPLTAEQQCANRKGEGVVWIRFAQECMDFIGFGGFALKYLLTFSSIIAGGVFMYASFKYLSSRGDPSALADARDMLTQASIGIALIASAFVIIQLLDSTFILTEGSQFIYLLPFSDM